MNLYQILGVDNEASLPEIKRAFRRLAMQHHPDRGGSTEEMQRIQQAYDVLSNPEKKARYDATGQFEGPDPREIIERESRKAIVQLFNHLFDEVGFDVKNSELAVLMRAKISEGRANLRKRKKDIRKSVRALNQVRKRLNIADDILHGHITERVRLLLNEWRGIPMHLKVLARVEEMLKDGSYRRDIVVTYYSTSGLGTSLVNTQFL